MSRPTPSIVARALLGAGVIWCALALFSPPIAHAHNAIDTSTPADGANVVAPLSEWVLTFANDVPLNSASAEIITADGVRTALPTPTHGATEQIVRFALPENLTGPISARWRLVGTDGHVVSERVQFTITSQSSNTSTDSTLPQTGTESSTTTVPVTTTFDNEPLNLAPAPVRWGLRVANYAALILFGGLLFAEMNLAQGLLKLGQSFFVARTTAIALTVIPALQALIFVGDVNNSSVISAIFQLNDALSSTPGSMTILRSLSGGVFIFLIAQRSLHNFGPRFTQLALVNGGVYLIALAYAGHSRSSNAPWLGIPVDVIHTGASAVWLGGLVVFIFLVLPRVDSLRSLQAFIAYGRYAQFAVIAIISTGIIQTLRLHGGITTLFTTSHGRLLLLKVLFVMAMLKVGDINRRRLLKKIPTDEVLADKRRALLVRASTTEAAIGGLVVAITATLVTSTF